MRKLELLSTVALLKDVPELGLLRGQVGTVIEIYSPANAEVEFVDLNGRTYGLHPFSADDLLELHHSTQLGKAAA